jgi:hypothetical protein
MEFPDKVRPIYEGLQGLLSQAPLPEKSYRIYEQTIWDHYNKAIDELNDVTGADYGRFKVESRYGQNSGGSYIYTLEYRSKLNDLIMRLHGQYFSEAYTPFSGGPSMIVNQSQQQTQTAQITMLLEFQSFIDKGLSKPDLEDKEKTFLEQVKSGLPTVKSTIELMNLIIATAKTFGIGIEGLGKIFGN